MGPAGLGALPGLGLAVLLGLLVGIERGWQARESEEGARTAGIRTFALTGLLGGLTGLLADSLDAPVLLGLAFLAMALFLGFAFLQRWQRYADAGATTLVAALVVFLLGALATLGRPVEAAAGAVITTVLLSLKPTLHGWLRRLEDRELHAALKLLVISVVLLPLLPDRGYGPWEALNPYTLWWLVVLIAGLGFAGYVAMRVVGPGRGLLVTGLLGGLVSSTAVTLQLSRLAPRGERLYTVAAGAIVIACTTMFPRMAVEIGVVHPALLWQAALPLGLVTAAGIAGALWLWWYRRGDDAPGEAPRLTNPVELGPALQFAGLLALITLLAEAARRWLGDAGLYALAAASGLADVDAITLSLAEMARDDVSGEVAVRAMLLAALVNTVVKGAMAAAVGGLALGRRVAVPFVAMVVVGLIGLALI
ncbi:MgtC/SapB family protein [Thiohalospira sp.]|uniref:MgtC/SapB family protein n=1 Tax=Thiohalospira sp. TaxID=3080549 RepID=UPI00398186BD